MSLVKDVTQNLFAVLVPIFHKTNYGNRYYTDLFKALWKVGMAPLVPPWWLKKFQYLERLNVKEIITEQQADWIVMGIAILATLISLGWGFYQSRKLSKQAKKSIWANAVLFAVTGPAIWVFWGVYNSIENFYGLDSVKALEINFWIVMGIAVLFVGIHWLIGRFIPGIDSKRRRT